MTVSFLIHRENIKAASCRSFLWKERRGNAALEFAFLMPVFLVLFLGIMEFGRLLWTQTTLQHAVEAAARYGAINDPTCNSTGLTHSYAAGEVFGQSVAASSFTLSCTACAGTQVKGQVNFTFVVPAFFPYNITLNAQSCYPT
jgi:Flp pilus assembly protein TadG